MGCNGKQNQSVRPGVAGMPMLLSILLLAAPGVRSEVAVVAVAANFAEVMERLEAGFEAESPHAITVTTGSTGQLYAQIANGAPFDALLAADQARPERLEAEGLAVRGSRFTYARGQLVLWSVEADRVGDDGQIVLLQGEFRRLAMANPDLAPYGLAARQVLEGLNLFAALRDRIVFGENVGQTHAMVATGNAELGFVARSYVESPRNATTGSRWIVPEALYQPIRQDAVLLLRGEDNSAARDLLAYLRREDVRQVIAEYGYGAE